MGRIPINPLARPKRVAFKYDNALNRLIAFTAAGLRADEPPLIGENT